MYLLLIVLILIFGCLLIYAGFAHGRTQNQKTFVAVLGSVIVGIASAILYQRWRGKRKQ